MADQRSVETPTFKFATIAFAYKRLAQGLSRSVSAFSSFMREYLDPVVKDDQCAQYVDDIGIAANKATDLTRNIRAVFECIRQAGLKLTIEKCQLAVRRFHSIYYFSFSFPYYPTTLDINIYNQEEVKQFHTARNEEITANRWY